MDRHKPSRSVDMAGFLVGQKKKLGHGHGDGDGDDASSSSSLQQQHLQLLNPQNQLLLMAAAAASPPPPPPPPSLADDPSCCLSGSVWPPRSYYCTFCRREFRSAQALGGHMNVHRRDRARLRQSSPPSPSPSPSACKSPHPILSLLPYPPSRAAPSHIPPSLLFPDSSFFSNSSSCCRSSAETGSDRSDLQSSKNVEHRSFHGPQRSGGELHRLFCIPTEPDAPAAPYTSSSSPPPPPAARDPANSNSISNSSLQTDSMKRTNPSLKRHTTTTTTSMMMTTSTTEMETETETTHNHSKFSKNGFCFFDHKPATTNLPMLHSITSSSSSSVSHGMEYTTGLIDLELRIGHHAHHHHHHHHH